jgi:predicted Ser/Thr protein kinase
MSSAILYLDIVFIGTTNEIQLSVFKELPEFQSFKGRLELVRVPYLVDYLQEERIYQQRIGEAAPRRNPHCANVAALWGVLTTCASRR